MNRAMFSGVAGLKTHQTKMDVIGNNIANVNTYGFKSQRAVFSDIFYQTLRGASAGNANRGGQNPSSVGYGSTLAAIQTQMTQSSMQNTGFGLDVAITGDGFLQVMDPGGNIFYTKAGMLDYDSNGYLTDINGNFVLGATTSDGNPDSQKIRLDNIGSVDPRKPQVSESINGIEYTVSASNATKYGNVSMSIGASDQLPAGMKARASISNTGAISVMLNSYEEFSSMTELNSVINDAIKEANGGKAHAAGVFTITADQNKFGIDPVQGSFTGDAFSSGAKIALANGAFGGKLSIGDFKPEPGATILTGAANAFTTTDNGGTPKQFTIATTIGGVAYTATGISGTSTFPIELKSAKGGSISLALKDGETFAEADLAGFAGTPQAGTVTPPSHFLGGLKVTGVSADFPYGGAMSFNYSGYDAASMGYNLSIGVGGKTYTVEGNAKLLPGSTVTLKTADAADGTITVKVPTQDEIAANLGLDKNAAGFAATVGAALGGTANNHKYTALPSKPGQTLPLTGAEIAGTTFGVKPGEFVGDVDDGFFGGGMTIKKTSSNFSGSGPVTGSDFTAAFTEATGTTKAFWTVGLNIGGQNYTADISEGTLSSSVLLKGPKGDHIEVTNPGFKGMNDYFKSTLLGAPRDPANGDSMQAMTGSKKFDVSPAAPSKDMGLSSKPFSLQGGTEGGVITLDELSSISIGSDGTVSVSHAEKGTVVAGKISLATFANAGGLSLQGTNYYAVTPNSGIPKLCDPGSDGTGSLKSSALEMSNVDLSSEFADMITTQRGFQANSRIITVTDTMLEELINLKR